MHSLFQAPYETSEKPNSSHKHTEKKIKSCIFEAIYTHLNNAESKALAEKRLAAIHASRSYCYIADEVKKIL